MASYYLIEHPTRGVLREADFDFDGTPTFSFSWAKLRTDEALERYRTRWDAQRVMRRMPAKLQSSCYVTKITEGESPQKWVVERAAPSRRVRFQTRCAATLVEEWELNVPADVRDQDLASHIIDNLEEAAFISEKGEDEGDRELASFTVLRERA